MKRQLQIRWISYSTAITAALLLATETPAAAAEHQIGFQLGSTQIGEGLNQGLVFTGLQTAFSYRYTRMADDLIFRYGAQLGGGVFFNRSMMGFGIDARPIDAFVGFRIVDRDYRIFLGPQVLLDYRLQAYPETQIGHVLWNTCLGFGPELLIQVPHRNNQLQVGLEYSLLSAVSRPGPRLPPYFYSLAFTDIVSNIHSGFEPVTVDQLARGAVQVEYVFDRGRHDITLGYRFDFVGVFDAPEWTYLSHSLSLRYQL